MSRAASSGPTSRLLIRCSGRSGCVTRTARRAAKARGIEVQDEFVELGAYFTGKAFHVLDERCLGEVLPYDDVQSAAEVFSGQGEAQPSGVQTG